MREYHIYFCPMYNFIKNIFDLGGLEDRFKEIVNLCCSRSSVEVLAIDCTQIFVHLYLSIPSEVTLSTLVQTIKNESALELNKDYDLSHIPHLWRGSYLLSENESSESVIHKYTTEFLGK